MKIQKINCYHLANVRNAQSPQCNPLKYQKDEICFKGSENKSQKFGLFDRLKYAFKREELPQVACFQKKLHPSELSDEENKSEEIKVFVGTTIASYSGLGILGKANIKEINSMLRVGAENFYEGTIPYNSQNGINITFGEVDSELEIPRTINVWENGQYAYTYEIFQKEPELKYEVTIYADNLKTIEQGTDSKLNGFWQYDKKNSTVKEFTVTENGFNYLYGIKKDSSNVQILKRLYFDFTDINGCMYAEASGDELLLYNYDIENDIWENTHTIEFEE